jgi:epoxyqueuosine reductase
MNRREFNYAIARGAFAVMAVPLFARADGGQNALPDISPLQRAVGVLLEITPHNRMPGTETMIYDFPVFGVSTAQDPIYLKLKEAVGPGHYVPEDLFRGAKSVISYFLPYTEAVRKTNDGTDEALAQWSLAHRQGAFAAELVRRFIAKRLDNLGARSLVVFHDGRYRTKTLVSNWSERHVAFISGLGTFGLHKSLITEKGCAGRLDSVITDYELAPSKRDYEGVYDRCINCYTCVGRCPVGAITKTGKDIRACARHVLARKTDPEQAVCGKCLTQVPCESGAPARQS